MIAWVDEWWPIMALGLLVLLGVVVVINFYASNKNETIQSLEQHIRLNAQTLSNFWTLVGLLEKMGLAGFTVRSMETDFANGFLHVETSHICRSGATFGVELYSSRKRREYFVRTRFQPVVSNLEPGMLRNRSLEHILANETRCRWETKTIKSAASNDIQIVADETIAGIRFYEDGWCKIEPQIPDFNEAILAAHANRVSFDENAEQARKEALALLTS